MQRNRLQAVRFLTVTGALSIALAIGGAAGCSGTDDPPPGGGDSWQSGGDSNSPPGGDNAVPHGGDLAGGDATISPISALSLCDRQVAILCAAEATCCTDGAHKHASIPACVTALLTECDDSLTPLYADSGTGYDAVEAGEQIAALQQLAASCDPNLSEWRTSRTGLFAVMQGTIANPGDCSPDGIPTSGDGASFAPFAYCQQPNVCRIAVVTSPPSISGTCGAAVGSAGTCFTTAECQTGLTCFPPDAFLQGGGICTNRRNNGSGCVYDQNCTSFHCGYDGKCAAASINGAYCLKE